ncbi:membrane progestin receptor gamma-B-like isoform X2 [Ostrea edulis]|uniref:membrane progestin receptor gamma-B-like isoform X2 n=1 Tax=Ostrea edulis TaxID=37623 RepID=UPI002094C272|nr:membrane progestin receptor gamma-B-like isoform X2 [Ostrea edulis]
MSHSGREKLTRMASRGLSGPTYNIHQVPEHFHEHFIISGYRHPKSTPLQCLLSVFDATNETFNFWTHFLPSCYFFWVLRNLSDTLDFKHDSYTWPLLGYMFVCIIFPLASATAHTFNTMSTLARHICFFMDYGALSIFSLGVAIAYRAYCFPSDLKDTWFGQHYSDIALVNSIICTIVSCQTRFMPTSSLRKVLRLGAFAWPYCYDSIPIVYRLLLCSPEDCSLQSQFIHARQFIFALLAAFLYATHLPERLHPGRFDIIGHSHQLFHVCSILGTMDQMQAILYDMRARGPLLRGRDWEFSCAWSTIGVILSVMTVNSLIILLFSLKLKFYHNKVK